MLEDVCHSHTVVLDDRYLVFGEYQAHLNFSGAPGMGDVFFKHVFNHMHGGTSVRMVPISPCADERRGFEELPSNELDPSDRKFLAVAAVAHAEILNATDSDWSQREALMTEPDVFLYGEEIYGVHSIEYDPVPENRTFYAFALRFGDGSFGSFRETAALAQARAIPVVPVLFEGTFDTVRQVRDFVSEAHGQPSALGGEREGVVLRVAAGFSDADFQDSICKSVRVGHVQSDEHWSKRWRPCRIARP